MFFILFSPRFYTFTTSNLLNINKYERILLDMNEVSMKYLLWLIAACMISVSLLNAAPSPISENLPNAMQHMVKAPKIDFPNLRDPFASYLSRVHSHNQRVTTIQPQQSNRKREPLEQFGLETLRLVGIFSMGGERVAMIEDAMTKGYIIRRGNHLGKHNGKVEKITNDTLFLVEEARDPAGEVTDRQVSLTLNEVN
ncbi:MAG: pilus assembly protein PilP [Mariprofundaceae bacterium]|nr:pilus assembly protein PilP [Mariprofundaceae bacterium]